MKPILFNTEMVRAILDGKKTVTRRLIKPQPKHCMMSQAGLVTSEKPISIVNGLIAAEYGALVKPPYQTGDILYVRETWYKDAGRYMYRANYSDEEKFYRNGKEVQIKWCPSIHMPKEAARLFLRVTDVRAERLQDIDRRWANYDAEGMRDPKLENIGAWMRDKFVSVWDSTIKKTDRSIYGWEANPWVWVVHFERISKDTALEAQKEA